MPALRKTDSSREPGILATTISTGRSPRRLSTGLQQGDKGTRGEAPEAEEPVVRRARAEQDLVNEQDDRNEADRNPRRGLDGSSPGGSRSLRPRRPVQRLTVHGRWRETRAEPHCRSARRTLDVHALFRSLNARGVVPPRGPC